MWLQKCKCTKININVRFTISSYSLHLSLIRFSPLSPALFEQKSEKMIIGSDQSIRMIRGLEIKPYEKTLKEMSNRWDTNSTVQIPRMSYIRSRIVLSHSKVPTQKLY